MVDLTEFWVHPLGWQAVEDYLNHNDKAGLVKIIREHPEVLTECKFTRGVIADALEGKPHKKRKKHSKRVIKRNFAVLEKIAFYIGCGYPIKHSPHTTKTCCNLAAIDFKLSPETVESEIYRKHKEFISGITEIFFLYSSYMQGKEESGFTGTPPDCKFVRKILFMSGGYKE